MFVWVRVTTALIGWATWVFGTGGIVIENWGTGVSHGVDVFDGGPQL